MWASIQIIRNRGRKLPPRADGFLPRVSGNLQTVRVPGESGKAVEALALLTGQVKDTLHLYQPRIVRVQGQIITLRGLECTPDMAWCVQEWECQIAVDFKPSADTAHIPYPQRA